jgi:hypothetical protein
VFRIRANERDIAIDDGYIYVRDDFTRLNADPLSIMDHQVGALAPHCNIYE